MVLIPVTVTDRNARTVMGLHAEDFSVFDNGTPQPIRSFTSEDTPSSVALVLDVSGSMRDSLTTAKSAAQAFFQTANQYDEFLLLTVSTEPQALSNFTTDIADIQEKIGYTKPAGMTALIDTVYLGMNRMRKANQPRRAILVVSDGIDNYSRYSESELLRVALEADVQIYTIVVPTTSGGVSTAAPYVPRMAAKPWDQARDRQGPSMLEKLSEKTGGLCLRVRRGNEATEAATKVGQALRNQYVIGYQPPENDNSGRWHRVKVKSRLPKVNIYARTGYYAE